jgi:hypothetical protein
MATTIQAIPAQVNLDLYQGDDFTMTLTVTNPDGSEADLTDAIIAAQVRKTPPDETVIARFTPAHSVNVITLWLPGAESAKLGATQAWDCDMTDAGGRITTLVYGTLTAKSEVTRGVGEVVTPGG